MKPNNLLTQPLIGVLTSVAAVVALSSYGAVEGFDTDGVPLTRAGLLLVVLVGARALAYRFPIHIGPSTKITVDTALLCLAAILLPPLVAAPAAGMGTVAGIWLIRNHIDLLPSDVASDAGRRVLVILAASIVAHEGLLPSQEAVRMVAAGLTVWTGEILSAPLLFCPISGDSPARVCRAVLREAGTLEAAQCFIGVVAATIALYQPLALALLALPIVALHREIKRRKELQDKTRRMLELMADEVDLRDPYTGGHSRRVAEYTARILQALGVKGPEVDLVLNAARVHDIGKIGIPDAILQKPGRLTDEEMEVMQTHAARGAELLEQYPDFRRGTGIVRGHHEAWDGSGYPDGLKGRDIPWGARVIAVADSFDAMTSDRPYRKGMPVPVALNILREGSGRQWDAEIVDAMFRAMAEESEQQPVVLEMVTEQAPERTTMKEAV